MLVNIPSAVLTTIGCASFNQGIGGKGPGYLCIQHFCTLAFYNCLIATYVLKHMTHCGTSVTPFAPSIFLRSGPINVGSGMIEWCKARLFTCDMHVSLLHVISPHFTWKLTSFCTCERLALCKIELNIVIPPAERPPQVVHNQCVWYGFANH